MIKNNYPLYFANQAQETHHYLSVYDKYTNEIAAKVSLADQQMLMDALYFAMSASKPMNALASYQRKAILKHCEQRLRERTNEFIEVLCVEVGKPRKDAQSEVERAIITFQIAADESSRINGEVIPLDLGPKSATFQGFWKRYPIGPALFITPFNFPLNLVAHKVAPSIACGCPFILKPASLTPLSALLLGEILSETDLPQGSFSILPCETTDVSILVKSEIIKLLSFTGSASVGWKLKNEAGKKKVILELGGNAACIIDENVPIEKVVDRLVWGAFYMSGQSCISVQRIFAHQNIMETLCEQLIRHIQKLKIGNPKDPDTFIGPMISNEAAEKVENWILDAKNAGAKILCGGNRNGAILEPTLLTHVPQDQKLNSEEAFGPVAIIEPFTDFKEAIHRANSTRYGLQAGVFTSDLFKAHEAWETLEVGGVIINDVPSWRSDNMPYGGIKDSGIGREGIRFAIDHLTEIRMIAMHF